MHTRNSMLCFLVFLLLGASNTRGQQFHFEGDLEDIICKEQQRAEAQIHSRGLQNAFGAQTDIYYQVMRWNVDPTEFYISGEITYYFKSHEHDLSEFHLDLAHGFQITGITSRNQPLSYTHTTDHLLTITLENPLAIGESDSLMVTYEGIPFVSGFGSFAQGTHAGQPIIWTLSEPYGVRDWWPAKQDLVDKIDSIDIYITTPPGLLAASNGKLMSITEEEGKLIHHWKHRYPIASYLVALAVTNYAAYSHYVHLDNGDSIEILNYVYPETQIQWQEATAGVIEIMELFNELFGTYPFADEKYGHAQFGWGGGMEHQTMSFMGSFNLGLQAHELAHQWFGDKVTCGSWKEIWLNEGFATYLTALSYERFSPDLYWPLWKSSLINSITSQPGGSVYVEDTTSVSRIFDSRLSYNKGAYVLHMLRWVMGDEAFFQACRDYLNNPGTAYDFGTTEELKAYLEARSGMDLDGFFADWYFGQGYPSYQLRWQQQTDSLIIWLGQEQSHASVSFFEMPVPVYIYLNGEENLAILPHTADDQRFSIYIANSNVDSLKIDPDRWILSQNNSITQVTTSSLHPSARDKYLIHPNPATDFFEVVPSEGIHTIEIIDIYGRIKSMPFASGRVDLSRFPAGYYMVMLKDPSNSILSIRSIVIYKP